jgi:hypothetical protein
MERLVLFAMTSGGVNGLDNAPTVILGVYRYGTNNRHFEVKNGHDRLWVKHPSAKGIIGIRQTREKLPQGAQRRLRP